MKAALQLRRGLLARLAFPQPRVEIPLKAIRHEGSGRSKTSPLSRTVFLKSLRDAVKMVVVSHKLKSHATGHPCPRLSTTRTEVRSKLCPGGE